MTLGERIRDLRKKHGLSQEQLADKLNVSRQALQKWESGINEPNIDTVKCIACYFHVDLDYLLNGKAPEPPLEPLKTLDDAKKNSESMKDIESNKSKKILFYILLCVSILIIVLCFIWSIVDPIDAPFTSGERFYVWYIPFWTSSSEIIIFQILNILAIIGIIVSLVKLLISKEKKIKIESL